MKRVTHPESQRGPLTWAGIGRALWRSWWVLPPLLILAVAAAVYTDRDDPTLYRSDASVVFAPSTDLESDFEAVDALRVLDDRSMQGTFAELLESPSTRRSAAAAIGLDDETATTYAIKAAIAQQANIVDVAVDGTDAETSRRLGERALTDTISRFESLYPAFVVKTVEEPSTPDMPLASGLKQDVVLAAGAAMMLWLFVALVRDRLTTGSGRSAAPRVPDRDTLGRSSPAPAIPPGRKSRPPSRRAPQTDPRAAARQTGAARS